MSKEKMAMLVRTVVLFIALINQLLLVFGHSILPLSENEIGEVASGMVMVGAAIWVWWRN